jgi:hypothetical protein
MSLLPFLPGLLFAIAAWIWPVFARIVPSRITGPLAKRAPWLPPLAPWIRSAAIPYLAVVLGWISARDYGLSGHTLPEWIVGALLALVFGALLGWTAARFSSPPSEEKLLDEARWILYRAACWPLVGSLALAVSAGLLATLGEFGVAHLLKRERISWNKAAPFLLRAGCSALLFLAAHNFFLALAMLGAALAVQHPSFPAPWNRKPADK